MVDLSVEDGRDEDDESSSGLLGWLWALSKHPVTTMAIGFFFTGIVGQYLTDAFSQSKIREEVRQASVHSIQKISEGFYSVRAHRRQVVRFMIYGADHATLKEAYKVYEKVYLDWSEKYVGYLLTIRESVGSDKQILIEGLIDQRIQKRRADLHSCVTQAYTKLGHQGDNRSFSISSMKCGEKEGEISYGNVTRLESDCLFHAVNTLHHYVAKGVSAKNEDVWAKIEGETRKNFNKFCPSPNKKPA